MFTASHDVLTLMLVTTGAGLSMFLAGIKKRRLQWRAAPRERRVWRRHGAVGHPRRPKGRPL